MAHVKSANRIDSVLVDCVSIHCAGDDASRLIFATAGAADSLRNRSTITAACARNTIKAKIGCVLRALALVVDGLFVTAGDVLDAAVFVCRAMLSLLLTHTTKDKNTR